MGPAAIDAFPASRSCSVVWLASFAYPQSPGVRRDFFARPILSGGGGGLRDLGGNAPEHHGCGLLNSFQTLTQQVGVSVPKLDVISGGTARLQPDGLADHESDGFGLSLADLLGGQGAALSPVQHLVADLVR